VKKEKEKEKKIRKEKGEQKTRIGGEITGLFASQRNKKKAANREPAENLQRTNGNQETGRRCQTCRAGRSGRPHCDLT